MLNQQDNKNGSKISKFRPLFRGNSLKSSAFPSLLSFKSRLKWQKFSLISLLIIGLFSCSSKTTTNPHPKAVKQTASGTSLNFIGVDLEQFDEVGKPLWKVKAKRAEYTKEKQFAQAENPDGELYQDGKVVYKIKGEKADIQQNGKQLILKGKILATDPINGIVLQGNELEWLPQEGLLIVRNHFHCLHKQLQAVAQEAKVKTREQYAEFLGGVIADSTDPNLRIKTEQLNWQIKSGKLTGDRPVEIYSYKNHHVVDHGKGGALEVDLKTKIATLKQKAQLVLLDPPIQINSNAMTWDKTNEVVSTDSLVHVFHQADKINVIADRGKLSIPENTAYFTGNVSATGERHQSLKSNQMTWYIKQKLVLAKGNVIYHQIDPQLNFQGETAQGNLQTEHIVVRGGNQSGRVVTVIIPQKLNKGN